MISCIVDDCDEGLELARSVDFNIIILDLRMPRLEAIECAKKIREAEKKRGIRTPLIAVTANVMPGDREKCLAAGSDDFLGKPFTLSEFMEKLNNWKRSA